MYSTEEELGEGGGAQCTVHVQNSTAHVYVAHVCRKQRFNVSLF